MVSNAVQSTGFSCTVDLDEVTRSSSVHWKLCYFWEVSGNPVWIYADIFLVIQRYYLVSIAFLLYRHVLVRKIDPEYLQLSLLRL